MIPRGSPRRAARAAFVAACLAAAPGCQAGYLFAQGRGQARVLLGREPVEAVLARADLPENVRAKLELARDARRFAEEAIGLAVGDNYTYYYDVGGPAISYALTAAPKDKLEPVTWWFPIVGTVPYLGFFEKSDAEEKQAELVAEGHDVRVRGVPAFSTLGWFADPIFSTMLAMEDTELVSTIVHELTHATLFIPGQVDFNENMATFVGARGAVLYFEARDGSGAPRARKVQDEFEDGRRFGAFLARMIEGLRAYYAGPGTSEDKIAGRETQFRLWQDRYRAEVVPDLHGAAYRGFADAKLDNAVILALGAYLQDFSLFDAASERCGGNLKELVKGLLPLAEEKRDLAGALAALLETDSGFCR